MAEALASGAEFLGMSTYGKTVEAINEREAALDRGYSQGLLTLGVQSQMQQAQLTQEAGKYGVSPSQVFAGQMQSQSQQFAATGQLQTGYELGQSELDIQRQNLEFARLQTQGMVYEKMEKSAVQGVLTAEDFAEARRKHEIIYGVETGVDWAKIEEGLEGSFVTEEEAEANAAALGATVEKDWDWVDFAKTTGVTAGVGAGLGLFGGLLAPLTSTVGAIIGGAVGAVGYTADYFLG